jgi:hypothetical protein
MSSTDPRDPRTGTAVDPDQVVVVHDQTVVAPGRTVVVPEAAPPPRPVVRRRRLGPVGSNTALWVIGFLVVLIAVVAIFVWALAPDENGAVPPGPAITPPVTDTIEPGSNVARALALPAPDETRTHTVNVAGDLDLLGLATAAGAVDSYGGAPVTADGVEVTQLLGDRAFEVSSPAGGTMVVFLPYGVPDQVFVTLAQHITFVGSVSPTSEDLAYLAPSAATAAAADGAYIIAVPESVHVLPPSAADETAAA